MFFGAFRPLLCLFLVLFWPLLCLFLVLFGLFFACFWCFLASSLLVFDVFSPPCDRRTPANVRTVRPSHACQCVRCATVARLPLCAPCDRRTPSISHDLKRVKPVTLFHYSPHKICSCRPRRGARGLLNHFLSFSHSWVHTHLLRCDYREGN